MFNTPPPQRSRLFGAAYTLLLVTAAFWLVHPAKGTSLAPVFESAYVISATDVTYPAQSIAVGTVALEVTISETGKVERVLPIREIASLTEPATDSVTNWKFNPASVHGETRQSRATVAVTFNPAAIPAANVPLPPLSPKAQSRDDTLPPHPVDVLAASFPQYPVNSIAAGTVVLRVAIDETARVAETTPVRTIPPLTSSTILALQQWKFKPAEFEGQPVRSSVALAFVFRQPLQAPSIPR